MTQAPDKEDGQWLNALAGQSDPEADPKLNLQAESLRRVFMAKKELLDANVPVADAAQYEQLLFRVRRENLPSLPDNKAHMQEMHFSTVRHATRDKSVAIPAFQHQSDEKSLKANWLARRKPMFWGLAATVVLGVGVVIRMGGPAHDQDDANTLRGGGQSTVLIVAEPEVRLAELVTGLRAAGEEPTTKHEANGRIVLTVKGSDKVLEYLATQRIEPTLDQGKLSIELRSVKSPK